MVLSPPGFPIPPHVLPRMREQILMVAYSFKKRFVDRILSGLGHYEHIDGMIPAPKRQTIRAVGKRRHAKPGETIQLYTAMRTKQCRKIADAKCIAVRGVHLKWSEWQSFFTFDVWEPEPNKFRRHGDLLAIDNMDEFARADGFENFADMEKFWRETHGTMTFEGLLIQWEPLHG